MYSSNDDTLFVVQKIATASLKSREIRYFSILFEVFKKRFFKVVFYVLNTIVLQNLSNKNMSVIEIRIKKSYYAQSVTF